MIYMDKDEHDIDLKDFPYAVDWPLHTGSENDDYNRFRWLEDVVGDANHVYDNGDPKYHFSMPKIYFKHEEDMLAYRLTFPTPV